jgi:hypothetical protein
VMKFFRRTSLVLFPVFVAALAVAQTNLYP